MQVRHAEPLPCSASESGDPAGVELIGLPMVTHGDGSVGGEGQAEEVQDGLRDPDWVCGEVLVGDLVRDETLVGEPGLPRRLRDCVGPSQVQETRTAEGSG
ncbi:MAG: hypothetical protein QOF52_3348 [Propionibacteriaceae bacterium]|nr:hypothetical protein [Propionibacteriaceae bacterium]MDX6323490.1 hypothetical protein [Propionibacteriaceae bacterium]